MKPYLPAMVVALMAVLFAVGWRDDVVCGFGLVALGAAMAADYGERRG